MFLADVATLEGSTVHESFEDDVTWAGSRTSILDPGWLFGSGLLGLLGLRHLRLRRTAPAG